MIRVELSLIMELYKQINALQHENTLLENKNERLTGDNWLLKYDNEQLTDDIYELETENRLLKAQLLYK